MSQPAQTKRPRHYAGASLHAPTIDSLRGPLSHNDHHRFSRGARQPLSLPSATARSEAGRRSLPALPKAFQRLVVAQMIGAELQDGFSTVLRPKLFGSLDAPTD